MYKLREDGKRELVYDVFSHVLHLLNQQLEARVVQTLLQCSLVSREWASFTIPLLYNSVKLRSGHSVPSIMRISEDRSRDRKIIQALRYESTYFPYRDFVRNLKLSTIFLVPYGSGDETALENWINWLNTLNLEPLDLGSLRNLHSLELTRRCSSHYDIMMDENNLVSISPILERLSGLETLNLFGFWLYEVPSWLNKFQCTTYLPENLSLFTVCLENITCLEEVDLTFIVASNDINPAHSRMVDWTGFEPSPSLLSIRKFRLAISSVERYPKYFDARLVSVLLRYVARCHKIRMLLLHHVDVQPKDIIKLSSELTILEDLELNVPSSIINSRFTNGWEQIKSLFRGRPTFRRLYFVEPETQSFREIQRGLKVSYSKFEEEFDFDEAFHWSDKKFVEHAFNITREGRSRRGLCFISRNSRMKFVKE